MSGIGETEHAAFGGPGWRARRATLEAELATGKTPAWSASRVDSEYGRLGEVLLFKPGRELAGIQDPDRVQHLERIRPERIARVFEDLAALYRGLGISVHFIDRGAFPGPFEHFNLMYVRDLFLNTRAGAVIARMGSQVRAGEEKYAALALARLAVPIGRTVAGAGLFEGADALWLDSKNMLCGLGKRTNAAGLSQLREFLALQGVSCMGVRLPQGVQHLLGILQIVDRDLAFVRVAKAPRPLLSFLKKRGFRLIEVPENQGQGQGQGMNIVTVAPRTVIMPARCPALRSLYERSGVTVAGEVEIAELCKGAGGIGCATGIVSRQLTGAGDDG